MSDLHDPRVLFAAERTLLAWNRTSVSLMAFGFVIERFGLFIQMIGKEGVMIFEREMSFYIGIACILLSSFFSFASIWQYKKTVLATLSPDEIPKGYNIWNAVWVNGIVGVLALVISGYLFYGYSR